MRPTYGFQLAALVVLLLLSHSPAQAQSPTGSLAINQNTAYTKSTLVTLTLSASDAVGVTGYYIAAAPTPPALSTLGWVAVPSAPVFSATAQYTLGTGDGIKTLHAWYRNAAGNVSATASASILLDQTRPSNGSLTATAGNGNITLNWAGSGDAGSGLSGSYKLVFSTLAFPLASCGTGTRLFQGTRTSFTHSGLTAGRIYYYRVCALDNAGNTSKGAKASATPNAGGATPPTGSLKINGGAAYTRSITTTLTLSAADAVGVTAYYLSTSGSSPAATGQWRRHQDPLRLVQGRRR